MGNEDGERVWTWQVGLRHVGVGLRKVEVKIQRVKMYVGARRRGFMNRRASKLSVLIVWGQSSCQYTENTNRQHSLEHAPKQLLAARQVLISHASACFTSKNAS